MMVLTLAEIEQQTILLGEGWGYPHARRVLALAEAIGADLDYDHDALAWAVYLHDWGAYPRFRQQGVDHALRSRQIAEQEILPQTELSPDTVAVILESIERHDYRDEQPVRSSEALLLREADFLDFLGVIGFAREFAWGPNNLAICRKRLIARRDLLYSRFTLPRAKEIATERLTEIEWLLKRLEEESWEYL